MMIDREHVFGLRNEVGRDVRDITRARGALGRAVRRREKVARERERERGVGRKKGEREKDDREEPTRIDRGS